jgi:hypothetical protein
MVLEHREEHPSEWAAIGSVAVKIGVTRETRRRWVRRAEVDGGLRSGVTTAERGRIRELERENRELLRANEMGDSNGEGNDPVRYPLDRSEEDVGARLFDPRTEADGVPVEGAGVVPRRHRTRDWLLRSHGRLDGARREGIFARSSHALWPRERSDGVPRDSAGAETTAGIERNSRTGERVSEAPPGCAEGTTVQGCSS